MALITKKQVESKGKIIIEDRFAGSDLLQKGVLEKARNVDNILKEKMGELQKDAKIINEKNILKKYWLIGTKLNFIDSLNLSQDDLILIWNPILEYSGTLKPSDLTPERASNPKRNQFRKYYLLGKIPWGLVSKGKTWANWSELFESEVFLQDPTIMQVFIDCLGESKKEMFERKWFRNILKEIRHKFKSKRTKGVFGIKELKEIINEIIDKF